MNVNVFSAVSIAVTNGKAYLPILASAPMGFFEIDPVQVIEIELTELTQAIEEVKNQGNPEISLDEVNRRRTEKWPTLRISKKRSAKQLGLTGKAYMITWGKDGTTLNVSTRDKRNRWIFERPNIYQYPLDVPIALLAEFIINDAKSSPEVW